MSYTPPFTITAEILNLVVAISEQVGELNASALAASSQLLCLLEARVAL